MSFEVFGCGYPVNKRKDYDIDITVMYECECDRLVSVCCMVLEIQLFFQPSFSSFSCGMFLAAGSRWKQCIVHSVCTYHTNAYSLSAPLPEP